MDHEGADVCVSETGGSQSDGMVVDLHVTDPAGADCVAGVDAARVLARAGAVEGQPFLLGPDGSYDVRLNRFFRELDGWGVRAANSIIAYARDVIVPRR